MERATSIREAFDVLLHAEEYQGVRSRTIDVYRRNVDHILRDTGVEWLEDVTDGHLARSAWRPPPEPRAGVLETSRSTRATTGSSPP